MYFIVRGSVEILGDNEMLLAVKNSGEYFGEVALVLDNMTRTAWVRARSYLVLARMTKEDVDDALKNNREQKKQMMALIRNYHNVPEDQKRKSLASMPSGRGSMDILNTVNQMHQMIRKMSDAPDPGPILMDNGVDSPSQRTLKSESTSEDDDDDDDDRVAS
jgi:signal-transduction protein with cAMP-binding, CBS, and nucleotidyltransferase domain